MTDIFQVTISIASTIFLCLSAKIVLCPSKPIRVRRAVANVIINALAIGAAALCIWLWLPMIGTVTGLRLYALTLSMHNAWFFPLAEIAACATAWRMIRSLAPVNGPVTGPYVSIYRRFLCFIDDTETRQGMLDDAKIIFDGIKQIALVVTIAYSLTLIQIPMRNMGIPCNTQATINWIYLIITILLFALAYMWLIYSFRVKPYSKILQFFGIVSLAMFSTLMLLLVLSPEYDKKVSFDTNTNRPAHACIKSPAS